MEHSNSNLEKPLPKMIIKNIKGPQPSVMLSDVTTKPASQTLTEKVKTEPIVFQSTSPLRMENTYSYESSFSAPTIADKVKLRKRGKSNASAKDIYKSISEADSQVTSKTRKRRKQFQQLKAHFGTINNFFSTQTDSSPTFSTPKYLQALGIKTEVETSEIPSSRESEIPSSSQESEALFQDIKILPSQKSVRLPSSSLGPDIDSGNIDYTKLGLDFLFEDGCVSANSSLFEGPRPGANLPSMFDNVNEVDIKQQVTPLRRNEYRYPRLPLNFDDEDYTDLATYEEKLITDPPKPPVLYMAESFEIFVPGSELVVGAFEDAVEIPPPETLLIKQEPLEELEIKEEPVDFLNRSQ